ncbi:hypothetical protein HA402_011721 [Bradysia odoriphaga]|nr:hypothetical protein HA402_011721 [Bradysia odoriphaga]
MWFKLLLIVSVTICASAASNPKRQLFKHGSSEYLNPDGTFFETADAQPFVDPIDGISYRLPNDTIPFRYDVWLSTAIHEGNFTFDGRVRIQIQIIVNTPNITLHSRQLTITGVTLLDAEQAPIEENVSYGRREVQEFLDIQPSQSLVSGTIYWVEITYFGTLRTDDAGFYRSSYTNSAGERVWLATTQFESTDARHAFPCYDEPAIRATYSIEIRHDASYNAISNTPVIARTPEDGTNFVTTRFEEIISVHSYLIAFKVSDFDFVEDSTRNVPHRIYARPQSIANGHGDFALSIAADLLEGFEQHLGVNYSLPKMDQAAIPDFAAGAMENWGLVTYQEQYLLYVPETARTVDEENIIAVMSHEFAHQWFGNLVAPRWWNYLWLNEGFATLYENFLTNEVFPGERWDDMFYTDTVIPVMEYDTNVNIRPMTYYVESPSNIDRLFDSVAYSKSGSILRMFQHALGKETWTKGLRYYLTDRAYDSAISDHLYDALQRAHNEDNPGYNLNVSRVIRSWETQSGYPYVNISQVVLDDIIVTTYTQNRFLYADRTESNCYDIPLTIVDMFNRDFENSRPYFWYTCYFNRDSYEIRTKKSPLWEPSWVVSNTQRMGYYRVNYDLNLWRLLTEQLNSPGFDEIHVLNRAGTIDDAYQFARSGLRNYDLLLGLLNYLERETDYIPWAVANRVNTPLNRYITGTSTHRAYRAFNQKNVERLFDELGVRAIANEPRVNRYARHIAINIACQAQLPQCLTQTNEELESWLFDNVTIHNDLVPYIYCNGIRIADGDTVTAMIERLTSSDVQSSRYAIITGLGCIQDSDSLESLFALAVLPSSQFTTAERSRILTSAVNNGEESINSMIQFLQREFRAIADYGLVPTICSNIASRIHNEDLQEDFFEVLTILETGGFISAAQANNYRASSYGLLTWQQVNMRYIEDFFDEEECPLACRELIDAIERPFLVKAKRLENKISAQNKKLARQDEIIAKYEQRLMSIEKQMQEIRSEQ